MNYTALCRALLFISAIIFINSLPVFSQVLNVEGIRSDSDTTGWDAELGLDFSVSKFNDTVVQLGNEANTAYFSTLHSYLLLSNIDLVLLDGSSVVSNGYIHLRTTFLRRERLSPELFLQYQYNDNFGLQNRELGGAGIRYGLINKEHTEIRFSTAFMAEYEKWELTGDENTKNTFIKSTSNLVLRSRLSPQAELVLIGYYQARPDRFFKPRIISESTLNLKISHFISFKADFSLTFDADPVVDVPEVVFRFKNGLVFSF